MGKEGEGRDRATECMPVRGNSAESLYHTQLVEEEPSAMGGALPMCTHSPALLVEVLCIFVPCRID